MTMTRVSLTIGVLALAAAGSASAQSFAPATGSISVVGPTTVTLGATSGAADFNAPVMIFARTGNLTDATGPGTALGTLDFSNLVGTVVPNTVNDFMTFADTSGGTIEFNVSSVQTLDYFNTTGVISLYLLGSADDVHLGLADAPTSETLTLTEANGSTFVASATIASPPSMSGAVPEPTAWALMLLGIGGVGGVLRRRSGRTMATAA